MKSVLAWIPWLAPAAVLTIAGVAKLIDPAGEHPRMLSDLVAVEQWPTALRVLGAFELVVAALLVLRGARPLGRWIAFLLLVGFSLFVAVNAADRIFVQRCGCLGNIPIKITGRIDPILWISVRNALLAGLLVLGHGLAKGVARSRTWERAALATLVLALAPLYVGERILRADAAARADAARIGDVRRTLPRWPFPDIGLRDERGAVGRADVLLKGGDVLIFVGRDCPTCNGLAPSWTALARTLATQGRRLVLATSDDPAGMRSFKRAHGLEEVAHVLLQDPRDALRLGVAGVPTLLALDARRIVVLVLAGAEIASFADTLAPAGSR